MDAGSGGGYVPGGSGSVSRSLTLHLGQLVQPYATRSGRVVTTADVAGWLEAKYDVVQAFWDRKGEDARAAIEGGLEGALEALLMGQVVDPWGRSMNAIQRSFQEFILSGEVERVGIPGVPTKAALRGVDHRKKHPYAKRSRRPSFRDTGTYVNTFRAWVD